MNRRSLIADAPAAAIGATALSLDAVAALDACSLANTAGTAAGNAAVAKVVSYVQTGVASLETLVAAFGAQMQVNARTTVQAALNALTAAAGEVGQAVSNAVPPLSTSTAVTKVSSALQIAVDAVIAGLTSLPGATAALDIARTVAGLVPVIAGLATSITSPVVAPTAGEIPIAVKRLGVMVP